MSASLPLHPTHFTFALRCCQRRLGSPTARVLLPWHRRLPLRRRDGGRTSSCLFSCSSPRCLECGCSFARCHPWRGAFTTMPFARLPQVFRWYASPSTSRCRASLACDSSAQRQVCRTLPALCDSQAAAQAAGRHGRRVWCNARSVGVR
jgi:hypothetical protein